MVKRKRLCNSMRLRVMYKYKYKCYKCEILLPPTCEIDHIVPLHHSSWKQMPNIIAYQKANALHNLCALCPNCHATKTQSERILIFQRRWQKAYHQDYKCTQCKKVFSRFFNATCKCV